MTDWHITETMIVEILTEVDHREGHSRLSLELDKYNWAKMLVIAKSHLKITLSWDMQSTAGVYLLFVTISTFSLPPTSNSFFQIQPLLSSETCSWPCKVTLRHLTHVHLTTTSKSICTLKMTHTSEHLPFDWNNSVSWKMRSVCLVWSPSAISVSSQHIQSKTSKRLKSALTSDSDLKSYP